MSTLPVAPRIVACEQKWPYSMASHPSLVVPDVLKEPLVTIAREPPFSFSNLIKSHSYTECQTFPGGHGRRQVAPPNI